MTTSPIAEEGIKKYLLYEYKNKENKYAIGSIKKDRFIEVNESDTNSILEVIEMLDGEKTIEEIEQSIYDSSNKKINVQQLCLVLEKADLLKNSNDNIVEKSEYDAFSLKLLEGNLVKFHPILKKLSSIIIPFLFITILLVGFSFVLCNTLYIIGGNSLLGFNNHYVFNIITIISIGFFSLFLHEVAHGITASRFGLIPNKIVLSLYLYISPIIYLKIPGIYTLNRNQRIAVWSAGVITNAFLFSLGMLLYTMSIDIGANDFLIEVFKYLWYINLVLVISNLNPLLPLDGYFILASLFKIPNLRKKSFSNIKNFFKTGKLVSKGFYLLYFALSCTAIVALIFNELHSIIGLFASGYSSSGVFGAIWNIKQYLLILVLVISLRIYTAHKAYKKGASNEN